MIFSTLAFATCALFLAFIVTSHKREARLRVNLKHFLNSRDVSGCSDIQTQVVLISGPHYVCGRPFHRVLESGPNNVFFRCPVYVACKCGSRLDWNFRVKLCLQTFLFGHFENRLTFLMIRVIYLSVLIILDLNFLLKLLKIRKHFYIYNGNSSKL